jgi:hypothetical protein
MWFWCGFGSVGLVGSVGWGWLSSWVGLGWVGLVGLGWLGSWVEFVVCVV